MLKWFEWTAIKCFLILINKGETELFGILCRFAEEKDKLFSFKIINGQNIDKKEYVKLLAQGICNVKCITEYVISKYWHYIIDISIRNTFL